jgi:hypothetical protein
MEGKLRARERIILINPNGLEVSGRDYNLTTDGETTIFAHCGGEEGKSIHVNTDACEPRGVDLSSREPSEFAYCTSWVGRNEGLKISAHCIRTTTGDAMFEDVGQINMFT